MKWYDSSPWGSINHPLAFYEGTKYDCDETCFTSFEKAKVEALKNVQYEIDEAQKNYDRLVKMTIATCPKIENPFG